MTLNNNLSKIRKKQRLKINNINDFKLALKEEGYLEANTKEIEFDKSVEKALNIDSSIIKDIYESLENSDITYRADNVTNFIEYITNIKKYQNEQVKLNKEISKINKLNISRVEYERTLTQQDDVELMLKEIEKIKTEVSKTIDNEYTHILENLENQLDKDYIYTKDIELLKKLITSEENEILEEYNHETKVKTISIELPDNVNYEYMKSKIGSIEYHNHIKNNIPRMKRLRTNIHKYMTPKEFKNREFNINQTKAIQDTINIAIAIFNNKEFKAISGSNDIVGFCKAPKIEDEAFKSSKVNKLGKLGIGYNRINDSEKKIIEEINRQIELGNLRNYGNLVMYSKWEPCPSCYHVISQFCKKHKDISVEVRYIKQYGESRDV